MDFDVETVFVALIGPAVTALATAVVVWLRDVIARRDEAFRRRRALETATQEVQFLQAWMAASRELDTENTRSWVNGRVREDLAAAYALVTQARVGEESMLARVRPSVRDMVSATFLRGRLTAPWARAGLVLYYVLLFLVLLVSAALPSAIADSDGSAIAGLAMFLTIGVGLVWLWRRFLLSADERYRRAKDTDARQAPGTLPEADIEVLFEGVWRPGNLIDWRPNGGTWEGRVRFPDGTVPEWLPAERLRYAAEPEPAIRVQNQVGADDDARE